MASDGHDTSVTVAVVCLAQTIPHPLLTNKDSMQKTLVLGRVLECRCGGAPGAGLSF
jgi:hypothetical protein